MKKSTGFLISIILLSVVCLAACSSQYSDAKSTLEKQSEIFDDYIEAMNKVENSDDMVEAINDFTKDMKEIIPELKKIAKKYPELEKQDDPPEALKETYEKISTVSKKISTAMMQHLKYISDPKVQKAIQEQGRIMSEAITK